MLVSYKSGGNSVLCGIGHSPAKRDPSASLWIYFLTHAVGWPADFNLRLTDRGRVSGKIFVVID